MIFKVKISAAFPVLLGLLAWPAQAGAGLKDLSDAVALAAAKNSVRRVAVLPFAAKGGASGREGELLAAQVSMQLSGKKSLSLIESDIVEMALSKGFSADRTAAYPELKVIDAVVAGTVFSEGSARKIFVKLVEVRTGKVIFSYEADGEAPRSGFVDAMSAAMGLPDVPLPGESDIREITAQVNGFRDAVSDFGGSCESRRKAVSRLNAELLEAKARWWAARLRDPEFKASRLTRNPGSEIGDTELKTRFYELLKKYYAEGETAGPAPEDAGRLARLMSL